MESPCDTIGEIRRVLMVSWPIIVGDQNNHFGMLCSIVVCFFLVSSSNGLMSEFFKVSQNILAYSHTYIYELVLKEGSPCQNFATG